MPDQTHHEPAKRVESPPDAGVRQRVMPVVSSILWKPQRDSHYVLASIHADQVGLRQLFVLQSVLDRIQRLPRPPAGAPVLGLLLGARCDCPITGTRYVVIESLDEIAEATRDSTAMAGALAARVTHRLRDASIECVGWFGASDGPEPHVSNAQAAVHASLFAEPWPTVLILARGGNSGAFFLHDKLGSRWFQAPFYEVSNADRKDQAAKTTCIAWPAYLTAETVVPRASSDPVTASEITATPEPAASRRSGLSTIAQAIGSSGATARRIGSALRSSITERAEAKARKAADLAEKARVAEAERKEQARIAHAERLERARVAAAEQAERDRLAAEQAEGERLAAEQERTERERAKWQRAEHERAERERAERERLAAERAEHASVHAQRIETSRRSEPSTAAPTTAPIAVKSAPPIVAQPAPSVPPAVAKPAGATTDRRRTPPRADDGEDTTASDHPYRYLALARREGFQVSENLERTGAEGAETVWLLSESEYGLQITLVTSDVAVVDATLHYNFRIKDEAVLRATSPEHRDLSSHTIYVRESCVEGLRAKCRRLRGAGALQREWKVTPRIYPPGNGR